ncbi:MAG: hypothetical protein ACW99F_15605 [Candidatus Hodarchaeales archaeon]|jgi:hypothetical protein
MNESIYNILTILYAIPLGYFIYNYYKLDTYLKKNRIELFDYIHGNDLVGFDKIKKGFRRMLEWRLDDLGEEDETINSYKKRLKISLDILVIYGVFMLVLMLLL